MSNADIKRFANELQAVLNDIEDKKLEAKAIVDDAKGQGLNTRALKKLAKEMLKDATKLAQQYEDEDQLNLFRDAVGIRQRKGIAETVG